MVLLWLVSSRDILKKLRHILCTRKFELYAYGLTISKCTKSYRYLSIPTETGVFRESCTFGIQHWRCSLMFRTEIFNRLQVNRKLATGRLDGMKSKPRFFSLILLICLHQTRLALTGFVDETEVESFVIERKISYSYEYFTVNMKPNHSCTNDHYNWCISVQATIVAQACSCKCWPPGYVFIAPAKKCIGPLEAKAFGGKEAKRQPRSKQNLF